ncbi:Outer membrane protein OmpA [Bryocella elongata]|uniref:Outer membrane protein OmpA n=1 Tax=Bryocella elongata TaxID=863522 RepID=A0A1H5W8A0_9BACT|nr:OmpA family protein [Bryocella elongata]SEF95694.1 Outer membrane protein OmpA [Bryocella elongata]
MPRLFCANAEAVSNQEIENIMNTWKKTTSAFSFAVVSAGLCLSATAQVPNPTAVAPGAQSAEVMASGPNGTYIYHVKVVERQLDAVNFLNRSGATKIGFMGTELMPNARGEAKVESVTGKSKISMRISGLTPANGFGPEYLTYVLWAISPDGHPQNLGELELAGDKANLDVSSSFQSFGMIITAEPYYAVSQPSDVVVAKGVILDKTQGVLEQVNAHYQLLPRGIYAPTDGSHSVFNPITDREHYPLALYEAHNAERIAMMAGADRYAGDIMQEVKTDINNADAMQANPHRDVHMIFTDARQAIQRAEDARIVSLRKEAQLREQQNQNEKVAAQQEAQEANANAANAQAQADAAAAAKAKADADRERAEAEAANARAQAAAAQQQAQASQQSAEEAREKLKSQLNAVLQTTESARGLIVNMNDVLFDTGKFTLKSDAQVRLAKISTILELYPNLKVQVEGYTDSTGTPAFNQTLSENRADTVKNFLVQNGVPQPNVSAQGFGATNFVADNATVQGRQQNRRVNLVVSGASIGVSGDAASSQQQ